MRVRVPTLLYSYTGVRDVAATGGTLAEIVADLDRQFPGLAFRIVDEQRELRPHVRFFVNGEIVRDLATPVDEDDALQIVQALSGG